MRNHRVVLSAAIVLVGLATVSPVIGQEVGHGAAQGGGPEVAPLIERVLEAYGGRERLGQVHSYRFEATMQALVRAQTADLERVSRGHDSLEVVIHYADQGEVRSLVEGRGWRGASRDTLQEVQGPMLNSMRTQAMRANVPWVLAELAERVELIDATEEEYLLGVRLAGDAAIRFWVDTASDRVTRTEAVVSAGQSVMIFATDFSDFREVEGVLFPFHEETWAQGTHTASIDVGSLQWNPPEQP